MNDKKFAAKLELLGKVVVAQMAERSLPTPKDPGLNPVFVKFYRTLTYCLLLLEKEKN